MVDIKTLTKADIKENIDELILDNDFVSHVDSFLVQATEDLDIDLMRLLLANGANPNINGWGGLESLLHGLAHSYGSERQLKGEIIIETAKLLLEYGANPNIAGCNNLTPVQICKTTKATDFEKMLVNYGANPKGNDPI